MARVSIEEFRAIKRKAAERKAKREDKAKTLWKPRLGSSSNRLKGKKQEYPNRQALKDGIVRLLGLLDRRLNGPECRLGVYCPQFVKVGIHFGTLAYHLVPQQRGDSTRFVPANVIWACAEANCGEVMNRSLYRARHVEIFGKAFIEHIEEKAREIKQYSRAELVALRAEIKRKVEIA